MRSFGLQCASSRRWLVAGTLILGGCAGVGTIPASDPRTDGDATAVVDAPPSTSGSQAPSPAAVSNPAAARYVLPGTFGSSNAIGSIVVTNPVAPRTLDLTQRPDDIWDRIRTGFAIPNLDTPLVAQQQAWFLSHPDYLRRAVARSSLYLFHIVEELNKRGMPTEIALLPFVESAYNPMAYSPAHASGMWQFIPGTGKTYNLKQDWWRDERRDVLASTDAALTYLQTIYEMNGDWHLALASYNWGENAVKRAVDRNQAAGLPVDYLSLPMPDETRNYVPKLQALKNIIANPEAFGVVLPRIDNQPYFVVVERNRDIDVRTAARLANMTLEDFKALNPSFNRPIIQGSSSTPLLVPADRESEFKNGLDSQQPLATWQAHVVRPKETIERIATMYGMTAAAVREVNGLGVKAKVRPGQGLLVQKKGDGDVQLRFASFNPPEDAGGFVPIGGALGPTSYVTQRGDTLASIARRFGASPERLRSTNRLKGRLTAGTRLTIPSSAPVVTTVRTSVRAASIGGSSMHATPSAGTRVHGSIRPAAKQATSRR